MEETDRGFFKKGFFEEAAERHPDLNLDPENYRDPVENAKLAQLRIREAINEIETGGDTVIEVWIRSIPGKEGPSEESFKMINSKDRPASVKRLIRILNDLDVYIQNPNFHYNIHPYLNSMTREEARKIYE